MAIIQSFLDFWTGRTSDAMRPGDELLARRGLGFVRVPAAAGGLFDTRAELAASSVADGLTHVRTAGYATVGDGGGALYKRAVSEPAHAGKVQSADGVWWELAETVVHPRMFGAVGDGVTDDTDEIQDSIDAAVAISAKWHLRPGNYIVSGPTAGACLTIPGSLTMRGGGFGGGTLTTASAAAIIASVDTDDITIEGLNFVGPATTARIAWSSAITLRGVLRSIVRGNTFRNFGNGVITHAKQGFGGSDLIADGTRQAEKTVIADNIIEDCWGTVAILSKFVGYKTARITGNLISNACAIGISVESEDSDVTEFAEEVIVSQNHILDCDFAKSSGLSNVAYGISVGERARKVIVTENLITRVDGSTLAYGIGFDVSVLQGDTPVTEIVCVGNSVSEIAASSGRGSAIQLVAGDASVTDIVISSNVLKAAEVGIFIDTASGSKTLGDVQRAVISNNVITDMTEFGMWSVNTGGSGELTMANAIVSGNVVSTCGSHGITIRLSDSVVSGNVVTGCGGDGIQITVGPRNNIVGNVAVGNGTSGIIGTGDYASYKNNKCMNNGQTGTGYGIYHQSGSATELIGNDCSDNQGSPTQEYGLRAPNGSTVRLNSLLNNSLATIFNGIGVHNTGTYDAGLNRTA